MKKISLVTMRSTIAALLLCGTAMVGGTVVVGTVLVGTVLVGRTAPAWAQDAQAEDAESEDAEAKDAPAQDTPPEDAEADAAPAPKKPAVKPKVKPAPVVKTPVLKISETHLPKPPGPAKAPPPPAPTGPIKPTAFAYPAGKLNPEPLPLIHLQAKPEPMNIEGDPNKEVIKKTGEDAVKFARYAAINERDKFVMPTENLAIKPTQFCVGAKCFTNYKDVATAIYGTTASAQRLPVFCAPAPLAAKQAGADPELAYWDTKKVQCTGDWVRTLNWYPWKSVKGKDGLVREEPNEAPREGQIPPYACFGQPHVMTHFITPAGGQVPNSDFYCRKRVFRYLSKSAEMSEADALKNIATMCLEMRAQVWGEKYKDINQKYQKWCSTHKDPKVRAACPSLKQVTPGPGGQIPALPFMKLSREELTFFFGHQQLYCRGDRVGLVHFLDEENHNSGSLSKGFAPTFTCGVGRGLIEAGPFEEGVQTCALAPYFGGKAPQTAKCSKSTAKNKCLENDVFKARLHCWKFDRPTCELASQDPQPFDIPGQSPFDAYDALREFRRTRLLKAMTLYDLKDAEKIAGFFESLSYSDSTKDEGVFGVKDFCRFVGDQKTLMCGYNKETMANYYELRQDQKPKCKAGLCEFGNYEMGYMCGLFKSDELFKGKPYWMCGFNEGAAQEQLKDARGVCIGGKAALKFLSSKGDKSSLQCYERRYRFGETAVSVKMAKDFSWKTLVEGAIKRVHEDKDGVSAKRFAWIMRHPDGKDKPAQPADAAKGAAARAADAKQLLDWATGFGHTLGHRTSMRLAVMLANNIDAIGAFKKLRFWPKGIAPANAPDPKAAPAEDISRPTPADLLADNGGNQGKAKSNSDTDRSATAKDLNDQLLEVLRGDSAPDEKFFQDFAGAAYEGGFLRISKAALSTVYRVHRMFMVLDEARRGLLNIAKEYARAILAEAGKKEKANEAMLTRLEVFDAATNARWKKDFPGTMHCIPSRSTGDLASFAKADPKALEYYVCGFSALLPVGMTELVIETRAKEDPFDPLETSNVDCAANAGAGANAQKVSDCWAQARKQEYEKWAVKVRKQVKAEWCYGSAADKPVYGENASPALYSNMLSSPFFMEPPPAAVSDDSLAFKAKSPWNWKAKLTWLKCTGFAYSDENWGASAPKVPGAKVLKAAEAAAKQQAVDTSGGTGPDAIKQKELAKPSATKPVVGSMAQADSLRGELANALAGEKVPKDKAKEAGDKTKEMVAKVGGFVGTILEMAGPTYAKMHAFIMDTIAPKPEFLQEWAEKFAEKAKPIWQADAKAIGAKADLMEKTYTERRQKNEEAESEKDSSEVQTALTDFDAKDKALRDLYISSKDGLRTLVEEQNTEYAKKVDEGKVAFDKAQGEQQTLKEDAVAKCADASADYQGKLTAAKPVQEKAAANKVKMCELATGARSDYKSVMQAKAKEFKELKKEALDAMTTAVKEKTTESKLEIKAAETARAEALKLYETKKAEFEKLKQDNVTALNAWKAGELKALVVMIQGTKQRNQVVHGSAEVFNLYVEDTIKRFQEALRPIIEPYMKQIFDIGWKFVDPILDIIQTAILSVVAAIPFGIGSAMVPPLTMLFKFLRDMLKDFVFQKLVDLVDLAVGKAVQGVVAKLLQPTQKQFLPKIKGACDEEKVEVGENAEISPCPNEVGNMKMQALLPRDAWLGRALACKIPALDPEAAYARAEAGKRKALQIGREMMRDASMYGKSFANRYLARYGYNYDELIAMGKLNQPGMMAKADLMKESLAREVNRLNRIFVKISEQAKAR